MATLIKCRYLLQGENVLITGSTGCGKSYLACALAKPWAGGTAYTPAIIGRMVRQKKPLTSQLPVQNDMNILMTLLLQTQSLTG